MPAATVDHSQRICEVWACNLDEEMKRIRQVIRKYTYVAMDTEFPGVVARPIGEFRSNADYQYQLLRCNVDLLKIIQLGLTFMNEQGEYPPGTSTWQFNFKFNLTEDMYAQDSIELLTTSGIQFKKHEEEGIETQYFAELLMTSGVVLCEGVKWLSFHRPGAVRIASSSAHSTHLNTTRRVSPLLSKTGCRTLVVIFPEASAEQNCDGLPGLGLVQWVFMWAVILEESNWDQHTSHH
ncbi:CCR4-NOT transcription complex subunit 7 isoform X2 [Latimeria chalumnae]|uniref:CCR4-NOT transcription complex subunit 7 isoform X2 n=1 Tax=Latimeria chalumnae TaxID=7897 RepID=UPI0006D8ED1B|nr:PREDICTED: CCR4-NOT transcription complex subunit 7 isoform X2 [Latimeria chalumnae]|eukprot:XP_014346299.1 PREDICTED: CCR4-NOT transcription complex subunit 7 isoform X2 [Latimeria chalumnae]